MHSKIFEKKIKNTFYLFFKYIKEIILVMLLKEILDK